ncbi:MAG TPA: YggS family pyridoxal phosphate-dependent enzyme [Blastocatellia bacterium]|nr:YggS family pyridoxal phosphate-dependent enzyme [Blastocatellia bacterium]
MSILFFATIKILRRRQSVARTGGGAKFRITTTAPEFVILNGVAADLCKNIAAVRARIAAAALRAGRDPSEIKLVAVSKTHPPKLLRQAIESGMTVFGENKVQEAEAKIAEIGRNSAEWHLIGHLQKNKARRAVQLFDFIHSVDSPELAERLERLCAEAGRPHLPILVQVDLAGESTKSGIAEEELPPLAEVLRRCEHLQFIGLMLLPPFFENPEDARPYFRRLRQIRDALAREGCFHGAGELSMGMSHDFEAAIEEGATIVRVGTAIFGRRERFAPPAVLGASLISI